MEYETIIVPENDSLQWTVKNDHCRDLVQIGSGLYGDVYHTAGSPYVVKLMDSRDTGYLAWAEVSVAFARDNPYLPRIHRAFRYVNTRGDDWYVFYIEHLTRSRRNRYGGSMESNHTFSGTIGRILKQIKRDPTSICRYNRDHQDLFAALLLAESLSGRAGFDIHTHNFMFRGKQVVITDPLC